jgi:hypothetical protein
MGVATGPVLRERLKASAEPVAREARSLVSQWEGAKTNTIGPRVVLNGVYVTQRARTVTGKRGDFGSLQMTQAFIPALEHNREGVYRGAEEALDTIEALGGF